MAVLPLFLYIEEPFGTSEESHGFVMVKEYQMQAKEIVSYIHQEMNKIYTNDAVCHGSILKDWLRNDAFLDEEFKKLGAMRIEYSGEINGFHDLSFKEDMFFKYIEKAELDAEEDVYFSINSFWNTKRTEMNIRHLNAFAVDYDFYKMKKYKNLTAEEMYETHIKPSLPIDPTFVIDSGRGLYCIFCIDHAPYHCTSIYKSIYSFMVASQEQFGADAKVSLSTQVIRVPGSLNSRTGRIVTMIEHTDRRYTIPELAEIFLPYTKEEVEEYKNKKKNKQSEDTKKRKKKGEKSKSSLKVFEDDLVELIRIRNAKGIKTGYREILLYLYWERAQKTKMSEQAISKKILWLNSLFAMPLRKEEALKRCRPAQVYKYVTSVSKMIKKLEISEEEQSQLSFLVESKRSAFMRQRKCRKKGKVMGRSKAAQARYKRRQSVIKGFSQGKSATEIASELKVVKKTIIADCKYIQEHLYEFNKLIEEIKRSWINQCGKAVTGMIIESFRKNSSPMWHFLS